MAKKEKVSTSSQDNSRDALKETRLLEGDDDVFEMEDTAIGSAQDHELTKEISEIMDKRCNFNIVGETSTSFPSVAMDFTFEPAPVDVIPRFLPRCTSKTKQASKDASNAEAKNAGSKSSSNLALVIAAFKSEGNARSKLKQRRKIDMLEEKGVRNNQASTSASASSLKAINKWKSLRNKKS